MTEAPTEPRPLLDMSKYASNEQKMLAALVQIAADVREIKIALANPVITVEDNGAPLDIIPITPRPAPPKGRRR